MSVRTTPLASGLQLSVRTRNPARRRVTRPVARSHAGREEPWGWNDGLRETVVLFEETDAVDEDGVATRLEFSTAASPHEAPMLAAQCACAGTAPDGARPYANGSSACMDDSSDSDEDWYEDDEDWDAWDAQAWPTLTSPSGAHQATLEPTSHPREPPAAHSTLPSSPHNTPAADSSQHVGTDAPVPSSATAAPRVSDPAQVHNQETTGQWAVRAVGRFNAGTESTVPAASRAADGSPPPRLRTLCNTLTPVMRAAPAQTDARSHDFHPAPPDTNARGPADPSSDPGGASDPGCASRSVPAAAAASTAHCLLAAAVASTAPCLPAAAAASTAPCLPGAAAASTAPCLPAADAASTAPCLPAAAEPAMQMPAEVIDPDAQHADDLGVPGTVLTPTSAQASCLEAGPAAQTIDPDASLAALSAPMGSVDDPDVLPETVAESATEPSLERSNDATTDAPAAAAMAQRGDLVPELPAAQSGDAEGCASPAAEPALPVHGVEEDAAAEAVELGLQQPQPTTSAPAAQPVHKAVHVPPSECAQTIVAPGDIAVAPHDEQHALQGGRAPQAAAAGPEEAEAATEEAEEATAAPAWAAELRSLSHPWDDSPAGSSPADDDTPGLLLGTQRAAPSAAGLRGNAAPGVHALDGATPAQPGSRSGHRSAAGNSQRTAARSRDGLSSDAASSGGQGEEARSSASRDAARDSSTGSAAREGRSGTGCGASQPAPQPGGAGGSAGAAAGVSGTAAPVLASCSATADFSASSLLSRVPRPWEDAAGGDTAPPAATTLPAFLEQQGMSALQAENCALELEGTDSPYTDTAALGDKMQALTQLLPGVDICALVLKDRLVLTADISEAAHRLIVFDNLLGGPDLAELISRTPVLLYADDVREGLQLAMDKLTALLPKGYPHDLLQGSLVEAPMLIFRMDYYMHVKSFGELPFDVQNLFVVSGGLSGSVYRSWDGFIDNNND